MSARNDFAAGCTPAACRVTSASDQISLGADAGVGSEAVEAYVRAVSRTARGARRVASTTEVAEFLGVTPASVSSMFKKLARLELVVYVPYRGVSLTRSGTQLARRVTRRRQLLEAFLVETLGMPLDHVHDAADRLEHHISCELEALIAARLEGDQPSAAAGSANRSDRASA